MASGECVSSLFLSMFWRSCVEYVHCHGCMCWQEFKEKCFFIGALDFVNSLLHLILLMYTIFLTHYRILFSSNWDSDQLVMGAAHCSWKSWCNASNLWTIHLPLLCSGILLRLPLHVPLLLLQCVCLNHWFVTEYAAAGNIVSRREAIGPVKMQ